MLRQWTKRQLVLSLNGGDAALFKFSDGVPFVTLPVAGKLSATVTNNQPTFTLRGPYAANYRIEFSTSLTAGKLEHFNEFAGVRCDWKCDLYRPCRKRDAVLPRNRTSLTGLPRCFGTIRLEFGSGSERNRLFQVNTDITAHLHFFC